MTQYTIYDNNSNNASGDDVSNDYHETLIERLLSVGICMGFGLIVFIIVNVAANFIIAHLGLGVP